MTERRPASAFAPAVAAPAGRRSAPAGGKLRFALGATAEAPSGFDAAGLSPVATSPGRVPLRWTGAIAAAVALGAALLSTSFAACAQDGFAGAWKIERSEPAPWVHTPDVTDAGEVKRLFGAKVRFEPGRIVGPDPLACTKPHYRVRQDQADQLFQGGLAENTAPATNADKLADELGFGKRPIKTLETGCASNIDFHMIDRDHALFALNNTLYRITRAATHKTKP